MNGIIALIVLLQMQFTELETASKTLIINGRKDNYRSYQKQLALQSLIH